MKEILNSLAFARTLVVHFGSDAVGIAEGHVEMHRHAKESNDSELWQCVADADLRNTVESGLVILTYRESCHTIGRQIEPAELIERLVVVI